MIHAYVIQGHVHVRVDYIIIVQYLAVQTYGETTKVTCEKKKTTMNYTNSANKKKLVQQTS